MSDPKHLPDISHEALLCVLARARVDLLKAFAETLIGSLGEVEVIHNRSGLVMLPMRDTAQGTAFHLGEVLVSEAHIRAGDQEGYGMRRGHDLEVAMAMAVIDLSVARGGAIAQIHGFVMREMATQTAEDEVRLKKVAATRVDMETF